MASFTEDCFEDYVRDVKPCSEETYHRQLIASLKMIADMLDSMDTRLNYLEEIQDDTQYIANQLETLCNEFVYKGDK